MGLVTNTTRWSVEAHNGDGSALCKYVWRCDVHFDGVWRIRRNPRLCQHGDVEFLIVDDVVNRRIYTLTCPYQSL